jgi:hypothetical protein
MGGSLLKMGSIMNNPFCQKPKKEKQIEIVSNFYALLSTFGSKVHRKLKTPNLVTVLGIRNIYPGS